MRLVLYPDINKNKDCCLIFEIQRKEKRKEKKKQKSNHFFNNLERR